ncbi:hypothetical protein NC651_020732 [Populus alba x Populus x berolinensis]|nr:hypothetical protein NC651_020732 [Populus alba x Populus x berolinensis]
MIYSLLDRNEEAKEQFAKYRELSPKKFELEGVHIQDAIMEGTVPFILRGCMVSDLTIDDPATGEMNKST